MITEMALARWARGQLLPALLAQPQRQVTELGVAALLMPSVGLSAWMSRVRWACKQGGLR